MDGVQDLVRAWRTLMARHSMSSDIDDVGLALLARWSEPRRRYHDIGHLRDILGYVDVLADHAADADAVRLAAWYHDAVFEGRPDDEELSARRAEADLGALGAPAEFIAEVARLIRMTAAHSPVAGDRDGEVLSDADLASLAVSPERYRRNSADIRLEFAHVGDEAFRSGRARVIGALLAAPALYRTPAARERWEQAARANLTAELARLTDGQV
jgi:predicted metal-dependent HD superfamily phosphohydrolase